MTSVFPSCLNMPDWLGRGLALGIGKRIAALAVLAALAAPEARAQLPTNGLTAADIQAGHQVRSAVSVLSVGTGICVVISCPNGAKVLSDCGSLNAVTTPAIVKAETFYDQVVTANDSLYVAVSHPDADHFDLVSKFVGAHPVEAVLIGGVATDYPFGFQLWMTTRRNQQGQPATILTVGVNYHDPSITPYAPIACGSAADDGLFILTANNGVTANNQSLVLKLKHGTYSATFMGDAGSKSTRLAIANYPLSTFVNTNVLVAAHHGASSEGANSPGWAAATIPQAVVFSAGEGYANYAHPRCTSEDTYTSGSNQRVAQAAIHWFTCYVKQYSEEEYRITPAVYNSAASGATVFLAEAGVWKSWTCLDNVIAACAPSAPQPWPLASASDPKD